MYLSDLEHMTKIWKYQQFKTCFRFLKSLVVSYCAKLTTIFPAAIMVEEKTRRAGKIDKWKSSMEKIEITSCNSVKVIFEIGEINVDSGAGHDQLNEINIDDLPELEHVWDRDPEKPISFRNLERVSIVNCPKTRYVFPVSIAGSLLQLQRLCLLSSGMETIVDAAVTPDSEQVVKFEFPQLSSLTLRELSKLHCFYPGKHVIVWPMLKKFEFARCIVLAMKTKTNGSDRLDFPVDLPLFSLKQIINRFRKLSLCESDVEMLSGRQFKGGSLSNIQHLLIQDYNSSASVDFPIEFLQKLCSLEKLDVEFCNFKELFPSKGGRLVVERLSSKIKNLRLDGLNDLKHIWSEESSNALPNLQVLKVNSCHSLFTLSKSSNPSSWINLTTLEVTYCNTMETLVSPITARSLEQLQSMTVAFCGNLVHVVGNEEEAGTSTAAIVFEKLRYLKLKGLTRMESFCSMKNYKLEFPSLKQVVVEHCPNLRIFFEGELITTPQLDRVVLNELENNWLWSNNLNDTIRAMHRDKVGYAHSKHLELSAFPELIEQWHNGKLDLGRLQCLVISNCDKFTFLLTPSMASKLVVLKELYVRNCRTIEQVIKGSEEAQDQVITFQVLNIIILQDCPNLTSFYKGSDKGLEFPALHCLDAIKCPKMVTFAHFTSFEAPNQPQCLSFFGNKVVLLELNILILVDMLSMNKIWGDELDGTSFKHLYRVFVNGCPKLLNIFPSSVLRRLQKLNRIEINNCGLLQEILESDQQGGSQELLFSQLERVWFKDLPKLERFCSGNFRQLQTLKDLRIIGWCPLLKSLISSPNVSQDNSSAFFDAKVALPKLENLMLKGMENLNKIWDAQLDYAGSFRKLYNILVYSCGKVENIFPSSMLENGRLQSLGLLHIINCGSMKEIVEPQSSRDIGASEETIIKISLPNLTEVKLYGMPQLKCFCSSNRAFEFPSLEEVIVMECRGMQFFSKQESVTPKLQSVKWLINALDEDHKGLWKSNLNATIQEMFTQKVGYSILKVMDLSQYPELIPIWNQQPLGILRFKILTVLEVCGLHDLKHALTPSMALDLKQLTVFRVRNCVAIEQVIAHNGEGYQEMMLFPKMEKLELQDLPELTSFGLGKSFEFPSLTQLDVSDCPLLETFISSGSNISQDLTVSSGKEVDDDTSYTPALFDAKVAFPILKTLTIKSMESLNKIWEDQLDATSFCQLESISVDSCEKLQYIFPLSMLERLQTLDMLEIRSCNSLEEIFGSSQSQSVMETPVELVLPKLKSMNLYILPELKRFFPKKHTLECPSMTVMEVKGCFQLQVFASEFPSFTSTKEEYQLKIPINCYIVWDTKVKYSNLEILELSDYPELIPIWNREPQGLLNFKMLTILNIFNIDNLRYALTPSMVLSLEKLTALSVASCDKMEQVIVDNGEGYRETLLFPKMEFLDLRNLPNLTRFGSGNCLEFPSLIDLYIWKCPLFKTFIPSTSNNTSQDLDEPALFNAKVAFPKLERLTTQLMGSLNKIWDDQLDANSFCELNCINVESCEKLQYVFPFSMLERFRTLNKLSIDDCDSLEEIFHPHRGFGSSQSQSVMETPTILLPTLTSMDLGRLPGLKCFFPKKHTIECPLMTTLEVNGCDHIEIFASQFPKEDNQLEILAKCSLFWVTEATFPVLKDLTLAWGESMEIWDGQHPQDYFPELQVLQLKDFPEQSVESQSFFFQSLPKLEKLVVNDEIKAFKDNAEEETGRTDES